MIHCWPGPVTRPLRRARAYARRGPLSRATRPRLLRFVLSEFISIYTAEVKVRTITLSSPKSGIQFQIKFFLDPRLRPRGLVEDDKCAELRHKAIVAKLWQTVSDRTSRPSPHGWVYGVFDTTAAIALGG